MPCLLHINKQCVTVLMVHFHHLSSTSFPFPYLESAPKYSLKYLVLKKNHLRNMPMLGEQIIYSFQILTLCVCEWRWTKKRENPSATTTWLMSRQEEEERAQFKYSDWKRQWLSWHLVVQTEQHLNSHSFRRKHVTWLIFCLT